MRYGTVRLGMVRQGKAGYSTREVLRMAKLLITTDIKREKGFLYFCGTSKEGYITVNSAAMARGRKKKT